MAALESHDGRERSIFQGLPTFKGALRAVAAISRILLWLVAFCFLRLVCVPPFAAFICLLIQLPLGPRFLPKLYTIATVYVSTFTLQALFGIGSRTDKAGKVNAKSSKWYPLLFGWYESSHPRISITSLLINCLPILATWDFLWRSQFLHSGEDLSFSRVGYVTSSSASIVMRAPGVDTVRVQWKSEEDSKWASDIVGGFNNDSDFTATITLPHLRDNTLYTYATNASHNGFFRTPILNPEVFSIATSSCIMPFFPYNPTDHSLRIPGLEHLSKHIAQVKTDFMLFLGDFIYIDIPQRYGWSLAHYRKAYRHVYSSPSWSKALRSVPFLHMYDDHEITNDWSANETGLYQQAIQPFMHYQHKANPPPFRAGATHFTFEHGDVSFFVMDNRRYRSGPEVTDEQSRTMLGPQQLADVKYWLKNERKWKVLVSSVPFTRNWRGSSDELDSWAGYLVERQQLLEIMWETEGVVIISGDRHEHATTLFPSPENKRNVIEFSTSPLSQFFQPLERTYKQVEDTDVEVYTHPWGTSKFGVLEFNTTDQSSLKVHFDLIVDGLNVWKFDWMLNKTVQ